MICDIWPTLDNILAIPTPTRTNVRLPDSGWPGHVLLYNKWIKTLMKCNGQDYKPLSTPDVELLWVREAGI